MFVPHVGEPFPVSGPHEGHEAIIVAVEAHGAHSWDDPLPLAVPPVVLVLCSCRKMWAEALPEAVAA